MFGLSHTCDIARNQNVGTNGRRTMQSLYTGVRCLALPLDDRTAIQNSFELGRGYEFYFELGQDVKRGDQLAFNGQTYTVGGLKQFETPLGSHLHVLAQQEVD